MLLVEGLLLLMLLTLGAERRREGRDDAITLVDFQEPEASEDAAETVSPKSSPAPEDPPPPERPQTAEAPSSQAAPPTPVEPVEARPLPLAPPVVPRPSRPPPSAARPPNPAAQPPARRVYGPPDTGGSPAFRDSERVGTAPNGEPLYAAAWYREPGDDLLRDYLSTARGPGWGLIACRTVPEYRVEDCVALDEYPHGSQIARAVLAAAWEFRVRPARIGGRPQVGSWVRIRIDYRLKRR